MSNIDVVIAVEIFLGILVLINAVAVNGKRFLLPKARMYWEIIWACFGTQKFVFFLPQLFSRTSNFTLNGVGHKQNLENALIGKCKCRDNSARRFNFFQT